MSIKPVVVMPTYNNGNTLADVIERTLEAIAGAKVIVVNDGSTDSTATILDGRISGALTVLAHEVNRGKAAALRSGFAWAIRQNYTHAVTIDTDGQHHPEQIVDLLKVAQAHPESLILGARDVNIDGYPLKSLVGRRVSNMVIRGLAGVEVNDSQSGFRVYPLDFMAQVQCIGQHYSYESEILVRAAWAGRSIIEVPIDSQYLAPEERVSHLNPWLDTLRNLLVALRLLPFSLSERGRHC